jgi:hypothetical protein
MHEAWKVCSVHWETMKRRLDTGGAVPIHWHHVAADEHVRLPQQYALIRYGYRVPVIRTLTVIACLMTRIKGEVKVWSVVFNSVSPEHHEVFASVGGNKVCMMTILKHRFEVNRHGYKAVDTHQL